MCALLILGKLALNEERHPWQKGRMGATGCVGGLKQQKSFNAAAPLEGWSTKKTSAMTELHEASSEHADWEEVTECPANAVI